MKIPRFCFLKQIIKCAIYRRYGTKGEDAVTEQLNERQEQIDILKVPHHGSKNSAKEAFLEAAGAKIGIISCGEGNSYGHPHKELLERLKEKQIGWYVTIERGAITVTAGKEINFLSIKMKCDRIDEKSTQERNRGIILS